MAGTRSITYASVSFLGQPKTIFSAATTWGQLKSEQTDIAANSMGYKVYITDPRTELSSDNQVLPETDFQMVFVLDKNNSGN